MLSTSSEVDYVPVIELTTYGLELTFFWVGGAKECRINCLLGCAHVYVYVLFCVHVCVWCVSAGILCELPLRMCTCACVYMVYVICLRVCCVRRRVEK
jgi:hypothetical protein